MSAECSIVVPLCNEEESLPALHQRLSAVLRRLAVPYEIIYVDDGSTDRTGDMILDLHRQDEAVRGIFLSRNFGHQAALCAGLDAATGRAVVTIDGDLQDPPELIPDLIDRWREGFQVVYARRRRRKENPLKRLAYYCFYRILRRLSDVPIPLDTGDFALMDRAALSELNGLPERTRFIRGLRSWVGFRQTEVEYDREARREGRSKYSLARLVRLACDGLFAFSDAPLKAILAAGLMVIVLGLGAAGFGLWQAANDGSSAILIGSALVFLGGVQLVGMGVMGEYLARIHHEVRGRPLYVTRERIGFKRHPRAVPNILDYLSPNEAAPREPVVRIPPARK
ncbi:MAG: dolichol-phosphate mannosyltransferase [Phycisphaerae bacterium]